MFIEYNKFTILTYFILGITITFAGRRWIYGSLILLLSASILLQRNTLDTVYLVKYSNITQILPISVFIILILTSLYVLKKSNVDSERINSGRKLFSVVFLLLSIIYSIVKIINVIIY